MVLSHYRLSPGKKKKKKGIHAGLQVLLTRHCWTIAVGRKEHYAHDLSHATALNYLYAVVKCACMCTCAFSFAHVHSAGCVRISLMSSYMCVGTRDVRGIPWRRVLRAGGG